MNESDGNQVFSGQKFQHHVFAGQLLKSERIINCDGQIYIYNGKVYVQDLQLLEQKMIRQCNRLTRAQRRETIAHLSLIVPELKQDFLHFVALSNGILDINTLELKEFSPEYFVPNQIDVNWNPDAVYESVDAILNRISCNNTEIRLLLEEAVGYVLLRRCEYGAAFFLTGFGSNGKSTYLDMIKGLIGRKNFSALSFKSLSDRFKTAELFGKLANIGDDIGNACIDDNSIFKNIATGNTINVERKGQDPFDFDPYAKLFFSANDMPKIRDTTDGLMRRLIIIPFNAKFKPSDPGFDPFIKDKLSTDLAKERLLVLAVAGLKRIIANKGLSNPQAVLAAKSEYESSNNTVVAFAEDADLLGKSIKQTYADYQAWCKNMGYRAISQVELGRELSRKCNIESKVTSVDGVSCRIYQKKAE